MEDIREHIKAKLKDYGAEVTDAPNLDQEHLFGLSVRLMSRNLAYFVLDLENAYNIRFEEEDFENQRFYSIAGLAETVERKMGASV